MVNMIHLGWLMIGFDIDVGIVWMIDFGDWLG